MDIEINKKIAYGRNIILLICLLLLLKEENV